MSLLVSISDQGGGCAICCWWPDGRKSINFAFCGGHGEFFASSLKIMLKKLPILHRILHVAGNGLIDLCCR